eukprot:TRINITY_DN6595_c0_g1_i1.p1 TRINITY_DN6595_c0_g1~~TRINITY_DN6595_c0_g1_i1.p1  ORF type:complete len:198 (-),score=42.35 TRINITY_DN6595_c0_g1_i1:16-552(-)
MSVRIGPGSVVSQEANISGDVTIGKGCVIHPKCMILAEAGPITLGDDNIIEEQCIILNSYDSSQSPERQVSKVLHIGSNNCFEVGCQVMAKVIGNSNTIEAKAIVGENAMLGDGCIIGMGTLIPPKQDVPNNTVIYGPQNSSRVIPNAVETHNAIHKRHLETLRRILPDFHQLKSTTK